MDLMIRLVQLEARDDQSERDRDGLNVERNAATTRCEVSRNPHRYAAESNTKMNQRKVRAAGTFGEERDDQRPCQVDGMQRRPQRPPFGGPNLRMARITTLWMSYNTRNL